MSSITKYLIVSNRDKSLMHPNSDDLAKMLDDGFTLVISWVVGDCIHHILSKDTDV
jgi:hypothetical protein